MAKNQTNQAAGANEQQPAAAPNKAVVIVATSKSTNKADKARDIFNDCYKNYHVDPKSVPQRKDIIGRFVAEAGLTPAGAATYLQNFKKAANLTVAKK